MKKLYNNDYVIFNKETNQPTKWASDGKIIIYNDKEEAKADSIGADEVIECTELPKYWQEILLKEINN